MPTTTTPMNATRPTLAPMIAAGDVFLGGGTGPGKPDALIIARFVVRLGTGSGSLLCRDTCGVSIVEP